MDTWGSRDPRIQWAGSSPRMPPGTGHIPLGRELALSGGGSGSRNAPTLGDEPNGREPEKQAGDEGNRQEDHTIRVPQHDKHNDGDENHQTASCNHLVTAKPLSHAVNPTRGVRDCRGRRCRYEATVSIPGRSRITSFAAVSSGVRLSGSSSIPIQHSSGPTGTRPIGIAQRAAK